MPEYLAPGVYVEEIDTGNKPIEGVSTSTAGMLGVTERGPADVPILVTSVGEYTRWFGGRLNRLEFGDHSYLPHAVEGFFGNGGKRVYVTRVLDSGLAQPAETLLFDRDTASSSATRLLRRSLANALDLLVVDGGGLGVGDWLRVGDGAAAEYRQVNAPPAPANVVALRLPLAFSYDPAGGPVAVEHLQALGAADALALDAAVRPGDVAITVSGGNAIAAGDLLRLGTVAGGDEEYLIADGENPAAPAARRVTLRAPALLAHAAGGNAANFGPPAPDIARPLALAASAGDTVAFTANNAGLTTPGDLLRISDASHAEVRRIGQLGLFTLALPAYADYAPGAWADVVAPADVAGSTGKTLTTDAAVGGTVLNLDGRQGLLVGDIVRIGQPNAVDVEYIAISAIPNRLPGNDPGRVVLAAALQARHLAGSQAQAQTAAPVPSGLAQPVVATARNSAELLLSDSSAIAAPAVLRVRVGQESYFHRVGAPATAPTPQRLTLDTALAQPHPAGTALLARAPLLALRALDDGAWGNRLRVSVQDPPAPLVNTRLRLAGGIADATHIRLDSANGVEIGTVLQWAGGVGAPFKVIGIDRQNGYLLTLDAALPAAAAPGDAVVSREFQLEVFLLRQPDAAQPSRDGQILDSETFRNLSLDPRHSRYLHKIIGTTWGTTPGHDDDGQPLRLSDRRSEGESLYVRVRDLNPTQAIRLGPEALVDVLADGSRRATRLPLLGGDDSIATLADSHYLGQDDANPENRSGLHSLRNIEDISIVACPGRTSVAVQNALINHCELMRYRFAVLDAKRPPQDTLADVQSQRQQFDSKYAALYHPWLLIPDPYPASSASVALYPVPPSGHVIGVYARTDIERGVHKAPANEVVRGINGLQRVLNKEQQDILNPYPLNINVIRDFRRDNRGIRVYGGRVITSDSDWKYVNVRRLVIFIEASIDRGLQWAVFEPNAEALWARVRRSIGNFLTLVWRNGGLEGTKPDEAFFVRCDRSTMTQTDIDSGRLIVEVGVAPVKPAEYVIIRLGLWTAHAED